MNRSTFGVVNRTHALHDQEVHADKFCYVYIRPRCLSVYPHGLIFSPSPIIDRVSQLGSTFLYLNDVAFEQVSVRDRKDDWVFIQRIYERFNRGLRKDKVKPLVIYDRNGMLRI